MKIKDNFIRNPLIIIAKLLHKIKSLKNESRKHCHLEVH